MINYSRKKIFYFGTLLFFMLSGNCLTMRGNSLILNNNISSDHNKFVLHIKKDLIIDISTLNPQWYIYRFNTIQLGEEDKILILSNNSLLLFSNKGKLIENKVLRRGEGPGEVTQYPLFTFVDQFFNIYLFDGCKFIQYDKQMKFIKNIRLILQTLYGVFFDSKGNIFGFQNNFFPGKVIVALCKFSNNGKPMRKIAEFEDQNAKFTQNIMYSKYHAYSPNSCFTLTSDSIIYGFNMNYKLYKYNLNGDLKAIITLDEKPRNISKIEKNKINKDSEKGKIIGVKKTVNEISFQDHRPFFKKILTDEKNRIYVIRIKSVLDNNKGSTIDIFSNNGIYLYRIDLPIEPLIIKNGYMYEIETYPDTDGDDLYRVRKFKILNYNRLKY